MDAFLATLSSTPELLFAALIIYLLLLCAIFFGLFWLWERDRPAAQVAQRLANENERLRKEVNRLRDILNRIERNTELEIENLKTRLSL